MFEQEKDSQQVESSRWQEVLKMIKRHPVVSILVLVLLGGAGIFVALRPSQATATAAQKAEDKTKAVEDRKLPVEISVAKKGTISSFIMTTAALEPDKQVTIL